jgi:hypothetical protein
LILLSPNAALIGLSLISLSYFWPNKDLLVFDLSMLWFNCSLFKCDLLLTVDFDLIVTLSSFASGEVGATAEIFWLFSSLANFC